jgi:hypothetical protein
VKKTKAFLGLAFVLTGLIIFAQTHAGDEGIKLVAQEVEDLTREVYQAVDGSLVAHENGVVTDTVTGLEWLVGPDRDTDWIEAKSWVERLTTEDSGWRMPTIKELKTLYRKGVGENNMSPLLRTTGGFVWTGEMMGDSYAWGFCFDIGDAFWPRTTFCDTARGFAVRSKKL